MVCVGESLSFLSAFLDSVTTLSVLGLLQVPSRGLLLWNWGKNLAEDIGRDPHGTTTADPHLMETTKGLTPAHTQATPFRNTSSAPSLHCAQNRTRNTHDYQTSRSELTQRRPTAVSDAMSLSLDLFGLRALTHTHDTQQKHPSSHSPGGGDLSLAERTGVSAP